MLATALAGLAHAQARSGPDWTTEGFDAQRTSWMRVDPYISIDSLSKFEFLWKIKVDNEPRHGNALTAPVALGNLMTFRGFKSLIFVGGSSNNVYAIDYDFGTIFWRTHHNYAAGAREYAGSATCPGGMTAPLTRATSLIAPSQLSFFGFARTPRPAKGDVGEPGKGAPQLAEIAARSAARASSAGGAAEGRPTSAASSATAAKRAGSTKPDAAAKPPPNFVFSVAADGLVRALIPDTGDLATVPSRLLPANATATGLIWADGYIYAATSNTCGGTPPAVFAMEYDAEKRPVTTWDSGGAPIVGFSLGPDGTLYVATGSGTSRYANSIIALHAKTLELKDWFTASGSLTSTPVLFSEGEKTYVAATTETSIYLLDATSLGGADHTTPAAVTLASANTRLGGGAATWRDATGTRWILTLLDQGSGRPEQSRMAASGAIGAFKVVQTSGRVALDEGWRSRNLVAPRTPIVVNGVVFALAGGTSTVNAVLYALHPATGKDLWSSGNAITSYASAGLSAGTGQVFVVTHDNTVWAFGIPLVIN